jgi:ABC-type Fe3+-hydroxamate transport system substrate-binding protein
MLSFKDQMGRTVQLREMPRRIVSLVPSQTELLFDLGLTDEVVGITKFCVHPTEMFQSKPRVGGTKKVNFEAIQRLQPDLIIGNKEENAQGDLEELFKQYPVWMSDIFTLPDALAMITSVGELTGKADEAFHMGQKIRNEFVAMQPEQFTCVGKKVAYFIWRNPFMVAGHDTFIDHLLHLLGMENVFSTRLHPQLEAPFGANTRYPEIDVALLQAQNPELILLSSEPYPFKDQHIAELQSILPNAEIKLVDGEIFSWYGSRLLQAPLYFQQLFGASKA